MGEGVLFASGGKPIALGSFLTAWSIFLPTWY